MSEATITCPRCQHEIKLTESLAAPLISATRHEFEQVIAAKDAEIAERETAVRDHEAALAKEKAGFDDRLRAMLKVEKEKITAEEATKARRLLGTDLEQKSKEVTDLQEFLKQRDAKLAEAQQAQAEVIRKQRELDDATRELELTVQKKVEENLGAVRDKARLEAEEQQKLKLSERDLKIAGIAANRGTSAQS
jgi:hypothetical protein